MTKSTGKLAAQRRREELLGAEMTLGGVLRHLRESASWAKLLPDPQAYRDVAEAFARVKLRLLDVMDEQRALR